MISYAIETREKAVWALTGLCRLFITGKGIDRQMISRVSLINVGQCVAIGFYGENNVGFIKIYRENFHTVFTKYYVTT